MTMPSPPAPAGLAELAGTYYSDELDTEYRVQVDDGRLFAYNERNLLIPLEPKAEDRLDLPGDGTLAFGRTADHRADSFTYSSTRVLSLRFARKIP